MFNLDLQLKKILIKAPLLKSYIEWLNFVPSSEVNTGSTDGFNVYYNPKNLSQRTEQEQQFTLVHEIMHVALNHMERRNERDMKGYNYACDAVINQMIQDFGIPISEGSINCPDAKGYSVEEYYDIIRNRDDYDELMNSINNNNEDEKITPHTDWGKGKEENNSNSNKEKPKDVPTNEKEFEAKNNNIKKSLVNDFFKDIDSVENSGIIHEEVNTNLGDVGEETSFLSWEDMLRFELEKDESDYDFFNGEFDEEGIWYYPFQNQTDYEAEVEIVIDTSYSVDDEEVKAFLREVKSIAKKAKIKIGCFNDKFDGFIEIKDESEIDNFTIPSRGGTNFEVAVQAFESETSVKIIFTDGIASEPKTFCDAIWVVYSSKELHPPGGKVFNININDYINKYKNLKKK